MIRRPPQLAGVGLVLAYYQTIPRPEDNLPTGAGL